MSVRTEREGGRRKSEDKVSCFVKVSFVATYPLRLLSVTEEKRVVRVLLPRHVAERILLLNMDTCAVEVGLRLSETLLSFQVFWCVTPCRSIDISLTQRHSCKCRTTKF
jgi:hypothetical protein